MSCVPQVSHAICLNDFSSLNIGVIKKNPLMSVEIQSVQVVEVSDPSSGLNQCDDQCG